MHLLVGCHGQTALSALILIQRATKITGHTYILCKLRSALIILWRLQTTLRSIILLHFVYTVRPLLTIGCIFDFSILHREYWLNLTFRAFVLVVRATACRALVLLCSGRESCLIDTIGRIGHMVHVWVRVRRVLLLLSLSRGLIVAHYILALSQLMLIASDAWVHTDVLWYLMILLLQVLLHF